MVFLPSICPLLRFFRSKVILVGSKVSLPADQILKKGNYRKGAVLMYKIDIKLQIQNRFFY